MSENNTVMDYAAQRFAPEQTTEQTTETAIVTDTTAETTTDAPASTEIVDTTQTQETQTPPETTATTDTVDYAKFLSENSDGLFTDVESFKSALPKIKEYDEKIGAYDTILKEKTELEEKLKVDPFVNEFTKTLDSMIRAGKSADEIENFTKISRLDLDQLSATDAKVMVMVKNGYSEAIARQIVEKDFPLDDYNEGSTERSILEEQLRVSSLQDRQILKDYKKELTAVDNSAQEQANAQLEQNRLAEIANKNAHIQSVKQTVPKIAETIVGLGEINLNGKEGEEAVKLNFDFNADFKSNLPKALESFFLDGQMEVNEENIALAKGYLEADYLQKNKEAIFQSIYKHADALATERTVNKYENRTGLPAETLPANTSNVDKERADFLQNIVAKKR